MAESPGTEFQQLMTQASPRASASLGFMLRRLVPAAWSGQ
jgi:hypothetical protein